MAIVGSICIVIILTALIFNLIMWMRFYIHIKRSEPKVERHFYNVDKSLDKMTELVDRLRQEANDIYSSKGREGNEPGTDNRNAQGISSL